MGILSNIAAGDQTAVGLCVEKYSGLLWSIVRRYIHSQAEAEEMIQEIYTHIWQQASKYDPDKGNESVFLATIARRRCIDKLRADSARPRTQSIDSVMTDVEGISVKSGQEIQTDSDMVLKEMQQLDEEARRFILLNVMYGYSHGEISSMTSTPLGTVKTHIRRGLNTLKQALNHSQQTISGAGQ